MTTIPFVVLAAIVVMGWRLRAIEASRERDRWNAPPSPAAKTKHPGFDSRGAVERCAELERLQKLFKAATPYSPEWKNIHLQMKLITGL
jgi:hypothetical protein